MNADRPHRAAHLIPVLAVIAAVLACYGNTLDVPFMFDEPFYITRNPFIKDFRYFIDDSLLAGVPPFHRIFFKTRLLGQLSFAIDYHLHGLDVTGYHVVNTLLHLANALLVYAATYLLGGVATPAGEGGAERRLLAATAALLFACHPIQTQAVTYIAQRFTTMATMFFLASFVAYLRSRLASSWRDAAPWYVLHLLSAVCAMKTKEIAFTLPLVVMTSELAFFTGPLRRRALMLAPVLATMAIIPVTILLESGAESTNLLSFDASMRRGSIGNIPRWDAFVTQLRVVMTYLRLLVLPYGQNLDYDYPVHHSITDMPVLLSVAGIIAMLAAAWRLVRHGGAGPGDGLSRIAGFGVLWFFITLSVETVIVPLDDVLFEHRLYLPSAGILIAAAAVAARVLRPWTPTGMGRMAAAVALAVTVLGVLTHLRNETWRDAGVFWEDVARKSPDKFRPHRNLGEYYASTGEYGKAIRSYERARELDPGSALVRCNLGILYHQTGRHREGLQELIVAASLEPDDPEIRYDLAYAFAVDGMYDDAEEEYFHLLHLPERPEGFTEKLAELGAMLKDARERGLKTGGR